jgi:hypothetical protein
MYKGRIYQKMCTLADYANAGRVNLEQSLIVNGFWRSGTTWVMDSAASLMDAKTVFEPFGTFSPKRYDFTKSPIGQCLEEIGVPHSDFPLVFTIMPYAKGPLDPHKRLTQLIKRSLGGKMKRRTSHKSQKLGNKNLRECFRPRVVTKLTRGNLCLRSIQDTFGVPVIHVVRDPRAVIASLKITRNGDLGWGAFKNFSLKDQLLGIDDGRREYFSRWQSEIKKFDQSDSYIRLTAYYCLTELYLLHSFRSVQSPFEVIQYETMLQGGVNVLQTALQSLGLKIALQEPVNLSGSSLTDWNNETNGSEISLYQRMFGMRKQLALNHCHAIEEIVAYFGLTDRLWDEADASRIKSRKKISL